MVKSALFPTTARAKSYCGKMVATTLILSDFADVVLVVQPVKAVIIHNNDKMNAIFFNALTSEYYLVPASKRGSIVHAYFQTGQRRKQHMKGVKGKDKAGNYAEKNKAKRHRCF